MIKDNKGYVEKAEKGEEVGSGRMVLNRMVRKTSLRM